jgi:hypothetical protein
VKDLLTWIKSATPTKGATLTPAKGRGTNSVAVLVATPTEAKTRVQTEENLMVCPEQISVRQENKLSYQMA